MPSATTAPGPTRPHSAPRSGALRVTIDPDIDDADLLLQWIEDRHSDLDRHLDHPDHDQWISVEISGSTYEYRVMIAGYRDGEILGETQDPIVCECNSEALLALLDDELAQTVVLLQWASEPTAAAPPPEPPPPPHTPPVPRTRLTTLGVYGVASSVLGAIATASGTALTLTGTSTTAYKDFILRDYEPLGYASLTVGAAALAAGISMVAIDLNRCKRRLDAPACGKESSSRTPQPSPLLSGQTAGLSVVGRF